MFSDGTGNLKKERNRKELRHFFESVGTKSDLTICNGAFEMDYEFLNRFKVFHLEVSEVLSALENTNQGGTVIIRFCHLSHYHTMGLVYLMCNLFRLSYLLKPLATCLINYEVYGIFQDLDRKLMDTPENRLILDNLNTLQDKVYYELSECETIPSIFRHRFVTFSKDIYNQVHQPVYWNMAIVWEQRYLHYFTHVDDKSRKLTKDTLQAELDYRKFTSWYSLNRPICYDQFLAPKEDIKCVPEIRKCSIRTKQMSGNERIVKPVSNLFQNLYPDNLYIARTEPTCRAPSYIFSSRFNNGYVILNRFKLHRILLDTFSNEEHDMFFDMVHKDFCDSSNREDEKLGPKIESLIAAINNYLRIDGLVINNDIVWISLRKSLTEYLGEDYSDWQFIIKSMSIVISAVKDAKPGHSIFLSEWDTTSIYAIGFLLLLRLLFKNVFYTMVNPDIFGVFLFEKIDNEDVLDKITGILNFYIEQQYEDWICPPPISPLAVIDDFDKTKMLRDVMKYNSIIWSINNIRMSNYMLSVKN